MILTESMFTWRMKIEGIKSLDALEGKRLGNSQL